MADEPSVTHDTPTSRIAALTAAVLSDAERETAAQMLAGDLRRRRDEAHRREAEAWEPVQTREDWEAFCAPRVEALRASLGDFPPPHGEVVSHVSASRSGDGFRIENLIYRSRPGLWVTANLYLPDPPREPLPAMLLIHSHHNPKTQGELQDMGMTWARQGCAVLVIDQLGYGERREHPEGPRQDYRFRAITGLQLQLLGDSLMGWMVWDAMRGIDLLCRRPEVDPEQILVMGSVAGGGDPAAVLAALDPRVAAVIPFNFGGPQPETTYPLPEGAESSFDYMGRGSWESTRNLRLSGRDGFFPWVIVASVAPRRLIYAHEFRWDQERDPVWRRLQRVFRLYDVPEHLAFAHGAGELTGRPPEATHCNNVGAPHRAMIHPTLQRWFGIPIPAPEYSLRLPPGELHALPPPGGAGLPPGAASHTSPAPHQAPGAPTPTPPNGSTTLPEPRKPSHVLFREIGSARAAGARAELAALPAADRRQRLCDLWEPLLGDIAPLPGSHVARQETESHPDFVVERILLASEPTIQLPVLLLHPSGTPAARRMVVAVAQNGKAAFLHHRAEAIATLLANGIAVCLPDVRGTGETSPGTSRERQSPATSLSATEWMLGQTLLGSRLRDLRSILQYLRSRDADASGPPVSLALWGDSFAPANPSGLVDPLLGEGEAPRQSEPLGGLLALFGALYDESVAAVVARGTLAGYLTVLEDLFCYVPHDAIVPGALTTGDLCDVAAALAPRPLLLEGLVDGRNCRVSAAALERIFTPTRAAYDAQGAALSLVAEPGDAGAIADWVARVEWSQP